MTAFDKQRLSKLLLELHAFLEVQKERSECIIDMVLGLSGVCCFVFAIYDILTALTTERSSICISHNALSDKDNLEKNVIAQGFKR